MFNKKNLITASLLSMGLALTACANSNATSQAPEAKAMPKAHAHHHKADMKGANPHAHMKMDSHAHKHMDMMAHHHFDKLDLTDAQKKQIDALKEQNKGKIEQLHTSLAEQEKNIRKQKEANASTTTLLNLYQQKQATVEELTNLHKNAQKQFIAILTPEQQLKMYEGHKKMDLEKHHPKMKEHHHHQKMETKKPEKPAPKADVPKPVK